jgi:lipoprotein-anchoring transpeptidase ErfK/SrfK
LRATISLAVIAFALAATAGGAAAQYYPPPPPDYPAPPPGYPAPPPAYPGPSYSTAPLPPPVDDGEQAAVSPGAPYGHAPYVSRDASGVPYDPRADEDSTAVGGPYEPYPPAPPRTRAASYPDAGLPPQRPPSVGGELFQRPPASVAGTGAPDAADITGTVRAPTDAVPRVGQERGAVIAALPPEDQPERGPPKQLAPQFRRQMVDYVTTEPAGTIIIDTPNTYLYLALSNGKAMRYGIGVGREGFTWSGSERISRAKEWPDWFPPKEMIERQPYLPRFMAGGESNPLGARALYLGNTLYRIHGTNQPSTIGTFVSSGCIRLTNDDIADLYSRVGVGTRVVVLPGGSPPVSASTQRSITQ